MEPLIVIILVDFYGFEETKECIKSILASRYKNYKIVVVNNTSNKGTELENDLIISNNADIVNTGCNLGFSGGNNYGIRFAKERYNPDFYLLLNNDTVVHPSFINELLSGYFSENGVGLVTGKIKMYPHTHKIWYGGGDYNESICSTKMRGYGKDDDGSYNSSEYVKFAPGCLFFFHSTLLDKIGYMSEEYFLYCEDTDYVFRVIKSGLNVLYWPKAVIAHKESVATGKGSPMHQYYLTRNKLLIIKKYAKNRFVKIKSYLRFFYIIWKSVLRGRNNFKCIADAYMDFIKGSFGKNPKYSKD